MSRRTGQANRRTERRKDTARAGAPSPAGGRAWTLWIIPAILIAVTFAIYWQTGSMSFLGWDDDVNIYANPNLNPVTPSHVLSFWTGRYNNLYTPVTYTVWALIALLAHAPAPLPTPNPGLLSNLSPGVFHLANAALHAATAVLVFALLRLLVRRDWAAGAGALAFAVHPVQVESVAWVTGMNNLTAGFFSVLALWLYVVHVRAREEGRSLRHARLAYAGGIAACALALLAKPTAVVLPLAAWMLDYWALRRPPRACALAAAPWLVLAAVCIVVTQSVQTIDVQTIAAPLPLRPVVAADALSFYLYKLAFPLQLGIDYGRSPKYVLAHGWVALTALISCVLLALLIWRRRRKPMLTAAAGLFLAGILPLVGLVPYYFHAISVVADRYLYLAMLGPALAVAWVLTDARRPRIAGWACAVLLAVWSVQSALQTAYWKDGPALYAHALAVNPDSWTAHNNLALTLIQAGDVGAALPHFERSVALNPDVAEAHVGYALALDQSGRTDEAIAQLRTAEEVNPAYAQAYNNLGIMLSKQGDVAGSIVQIQEAVRLRPDFAEAHVNLGIDYTRNGANGAAEEEYRKAVQIRPFYLKAWAKLGACLMAQGKTGDAVTAFEEAVRLAPSDVDAHDNLGAALGASGQTDAAIAEFREALRLDPANASASGNLAKALSSRK